MALSGQKVVAAAGTAVQLGTQNVTGALLVKALPGNTGTIYIGNENGDVSGTTGMPLAAGEVVIFDHVGQLSAVYIDSSVNGEGVAWLVLEA